MIKEQMVEQQQIVKCNFINVDDNDRHVEAAKSRQYTFIGRNSL